METSAPPGLPAARMLLWPEGQLGRLLLDVLGNLGFGRELDSQNPNVVDHLSPSVIGQHDLHRLTLPAADESLDEWRIVADDLRREVRFCLGVPINPQLSGFGDLAIVHADGDDLADLDPISL